MDWTVAPSRGLRAVVRVPGDKSLSHRALILAALAPGESRLEGLAAGADVRSTARALEALGVGLVRRGSDAGGDPPGGRAGGGGDAGVVHWSAAGDGYGIEGQGLRGLREAAGPIDCGNSGTTLRLLAGPLAGHPFTSVLTGDPSLRRRPMGRIAEPLRAMGAEVRLAPRERPPVTLVGPAGPLRGIGYRPPVASAQVKSCVLLAGLYADGPTAVEEPTPTRDHTERLLGSLGVTVEVGESGEERLVRVHPVPELRRLSGTVPGDISGAAYWLVAASLVPDSHLRLPGVGLNPTRTAVVDLLQEWGARIRVTREGEWHGEPYGILEVVTAPAGLRGGCIQPHQVPGLIDELPLLAALGPSTEEGVEIRGAAELRVKESDRIAVMAAALRSLGAEVEEFPDGLAVRGGAGLRGGVADGGGDHRVVLALAVVALVAAEPVTIRGAEALGISYPDFADALTAVAGGGR